MSDDPAVKAVLRDCFKFDFREGIVNAMSKKTVNITFRPTLRFDFNIRLVCTAKDKPVKDILHATKGKQYAQEKSEISILAKGDFPLLRFTDIRND